MKRSVLVAMGVAPLIVGCASARTPTDQGAARSFAPVGTVAQPQPIPPGPGALVAQLLEPTDIRSAPGGRVVSQLGLHDQFGSPDVLAVIKVLPHWLGVLSPFAGNGKLGWILRSAVGLDRVPYLLKASLSARALTVLYEGRPIRRYSVAIGASYARTPTGRFAVTDRLETGDPEGPYGCCILALSATAPHAIPGWTGGDRIAIHATPETQTIGQPDSHGCLRVTQAEARWLIYHVPLGTPVLISG
jgi:hypothetical protein